MIPYLAALLVLTILIVSSVKLHSNIQALIFIALIALITVKLVDNFMILA